MMMEDDMSNLFIFLLKFFNDRSILIEFGDRKMTMDKFLV
jgi:hypothetical protein